MFMVDAQCFARGKNRPCHSTCGLPEQHLHHLNPNARRQQQQICHDIYPWLLAVVPHLLVEIQWYIAPCLSVSRRL
jgi:hypothetical protein